MNWFIDTCTITLPLTVHLLSDLPASPTPYNYKFVHNSCLSADRQVDPLTRSTIQVFVDSFARVVSRALENATTRASSFPLNFSRAKESTKLGEGSTCVLV